MILIARLTSLLQLSHEKAIWPAAWWWAVLALIVGCAGAVRYTGYDFSLPYIDNPDEPSHVIAAQMVIDNGSAKPIGMQGYPPGIITLNYLLLRWVHSPAEPMTTVLYLSRFVTATIGVLCVVVIALLGYRVGSSTSGLFAGAIWAIQPVAIDYSTIALADIYLTFFTTLAILGTLTGTLYDQDGWNVAGLFSLFLAILFKYQAAFITPLILALPLIRLLDPAANKQRIWRLFAANSARTIVFFGWLFLIYPSLQAADSPGAFEGSPSRLSIPTFATVIHNGGVVFSYLLIPWAVGWSGLLFLAWSHMRTKVHLLGLIAVVAASLLWIVGLSFFGQPTARQFLAVGPLFLVLWDSGLQGWVEAIRALLVRLHWLRSYATYPAHALVAIVILFGTWGMFQQTLKEAHNRTLPDRRNDIMVWADTSLTPGPYIATTDNHKTFNRAWGGYNGVHDFPLVMDSVLTDRPLEEWRDLGVLYAFVRYGRYKQMLESAESRPYLDQMVLLKSYPPSDDFRGPSIVVFRIYPIQHETTGQLGPIHLLGYDIDKTEVVSGGDIHFRMYWKVSAPTDIAYQVYNHLVPVDSREPIAQVDGSPLFDERRSTSTWNDPDETLISRDFVLTLGPNVEPGEYRLITGFYQPEAGIRLSTPDGNDYVVITTISVSR